MRRTLVSLLAVLALLSTAATVHAQEQEPPRPIPGDLPAWNVELVAHRGLAPGFPENTLAALRNTIAKGVGVVELDLRGTADGEVVVLHDETVDRTTDGTGNVQELTLAQIKELDAGSYVDPRFAGERIPTYEEVLDLVEEEGSGVVLLLDIKEGATLDLAQVVRLTEERRAVLQVIAGVRTLDDVAAFRRLNPNVRTLGFIPEPQDVEAFAAAGVDMIRLWPDWIHASASPLCAAGGGTTGRAVQSCLVRRVHELGRPVWTTAGEAGRDELLELIELGVNGILTDVPDVLRDLLAEIDEHRAPGDAPAL